MKFALTFGAAALCALSFGQFSDNFESETGSAGGTAITGQNGWYNPVSGSLDGNVYSYSGNALGFGANAGGGNQFMGGASQGGSSYMRAQHSVNFGSGGTWTLSYDFVAGFNGSLPASEYLGSISLQPSTTNNAFQTLFAWDANNTTGAAFDANLGVATSAGGSLSFMSPGAAWTNLVLGDWYHQTVTWDFASNQVLDTSLQDITAGGSLNDYQPTDWYLSGGANNVMGLAAPTDIRFFVGGATAGNYMGFDNVSVGPVPEPATLTALGLGALALIRKRRKA